MISAKVVGSRYDRDPSHFMTRTLKNDGSTQHHHGVTYKDTWVIRSNSRKLVVTRRSEK